MYAPDSDDQITSAGTEDAGKYEPPSHSLNDPMQSMINAILEDPGLIDSILEPVQALEPSLIYHSEIMRIITGLTLAADACRSLFRQRGELSDLNNEIKCLNKVVQLTLDTDEIRYEALENLGCAYQLRFENANDVADIHAAVKYQTKAVSLTPDDHVNKPSMLTNLGNSHICLTEIQGDPVNLDTAIMCQYQAAMLAPVGHKGRPSMLSNLGNAYQCRFEYYNEPRDLSTAIGYHAQAVLLCPDSHVDKPAMLINLVNAYLSRFELQGNFTDISAAIRYQVHALDLIPIDHEDRASMLATLGNAHQLRFECQGNQSDIDKAIECHSQAVELVPNGHMDKPSMLTCLGNAYQGRFESQGNLDDINTAIEFHSQAVVHTLDDHPEKSLRLDALGVSYRCRFEQQGGPADIKTAIMHQLEAASLVPDDEADKRSTLTNLGTSYQRRFEREGNLTDINNAITCQAQAVSLTPDGHTDKSLMLNNLGNAYRRRFENQGDVNDITIVIESQSQALSLLPDGHADRPAWLTNLGCGYHLRFDHQGDLADIDAAIKYQSEAVTITPHDHAEKPSRLSNLGNAYQSRFDHQKYLGDIDAAIKSQSDALTLTPPGHANRPLILSSLGDAFRGRFEIQGHPKDIDTAIEHHSKAVELTPDGHANMMSVLNCLGASYVHRYNCYAMHQDIDAAIKTFREASQCSIGPPYTKFQACYNLAMFAHSHGFPDSLEAYQQAINLIPQFVWLGTTVRRRYERINEMGSIIAEASRYAITIGFYDTALEWLEAGRSIVWNQILQLRTPLEELSQAYPGLAEQLKDIGRRLEQAGSRSFVPQSVSYANSDLENETQSHFHLAEEWDRLLVEARSLSGFEDFLRPRNARSLKSAGKRGPIVMINIYESSCDALIITPTSDNLAHVPLPDFSTAKAVDLQKKLKPLTGRQGQSSRAERRLLPSLRQAEWKQPLRDLWTDVVEPILSFLGHATQLSFEQMPHITWCTTGPLSFLPLHAAGPYDGVHPNTFDLVISSYTPTLTALLAPVPDIFSTPTGILAIGQADTPGQSPLPQTEAELATIKQYEKLICYEQLDGERATVDAVLASMDKHGWVHLACHGSQNPDDPAQSAFHLHDGDLTLAQITKRAFKNKGLAFLSACHTATGDSKMPDEALHLAAGMLMAGYPSVIATMWSIQDEDGPEVAGKVYEELLKGGMMDHKVAARALHKATGYLREKVGMDQLERWAPFIHMGL